MAKYQQVKEKHGKPKPILFNTEMVQAILERRKTQTRRPIKPQPRIECDGRIDAVKPQILYSSWASFIKRRSQYSPGDFVYVRETFCPDFFPDGNPVYKADGPESEWDNVKWKPLIHMPKELARIFLKVTDVRVERLQEISEKDAEAEGFIPLSPDKKIGYPGITAKECFKDSWNSIYKNKGYGWKENPWVWVIEFERLEV